MKQFSRSYLLEQDEFLEREEDRHLNESGTQRCDGTAPGSHRSRRKRWDDAPLHPGRKQDEDEQDHEVGQKYDNFSVEHNTFPFSQKPRQYPPHTTVL